MCTGPPLYQFKLKSLEKTLPTTTLTLDQKLENIVREQPSRKKDSETVNRSETVIEHLQSGARDKTRRAVK